jgi:hypothetical protein
MLHPLGLADIGPIPWITEAHARTMFILFGSIAVVVVLVALTEAVRRRSTLPLFCLVGSVLCNPVEPVWDALGNLRFHHGNMVAFVMFPELPQPIEYPWWAAFVYTFFTGVTGYLFYRMFAAGVSWSRYWRYLSGMAVMNVLVEGFLITSGYDYYGYQPWRWGTDFPLWWVFTNYGELLGGALLAAAVTRWGSRAYPLAIVIVPSSFAAWELWAGWPMFAALHADVSPLVLNLAALFTAVIAVGTIWVLGRVALPASPAIETVETRRTVSHS